MYEIRHYLKEDGKDPYLSWWLKLRDMKARIAVDRRLNRLELGNFGDHKFCRDGVLGASGGCGRWLSYLLCNCRSANHNFALRRR